jgi:hypothetical protein
LFHCPDGQCHNNIPNSSKTNRLTWDPHIHALFPRQPYYLQLSCPGLPTIISFESQQVHPQGYHSDKTGRWPGRNRHSKSYQEWASFISVTGETGHLSIRMPLPPCHC